MVAPLTTDIVKRGLKFVCVCPFVSFFFFYIVGNIDTKMNSRFAYSFFLKEQSVIAFIHDT